MGAWVCRQQGRCPRLTGISPAWPAVRSLPYWLRHRTGWPVSHHSLCSLQLAVFYVFIGIGFLALYCTWRSNAK